MVTAVQNQSRIFTQAPPPLMRQLQADRALLLPVCIGLHRPSNHPSSSVVWPHSLRKPLVTCLGALWNQESHLVLRHRPFPQASSPRLAPKTLVC